MIPYLSIYVCMKITILLILWCNNQADRNTSWFIMFACSPAPRSKSELMYLLKVKSFSDPSNPKRVTIFVDHLFWLRIRSPSKSLKLKQSYLTIQLLRFANVWWLEKITYIPPTWKSWFHKFGISFSRAWFSGEPRWNSGVAYIPQMVVKNGDLLW